MKVVVDERYWISKFDVDGDCVYVGDPSPTTGAVRDRIFTAFTANGMVPIDLIDASVYLRFEDVQNLLLTPAQLVALSEITARNRMCGIDVIPRDKAIVPLLPLFTNRNIASFTWPRESYARDGVTCGSIQSGTGGSNSEDRLNLSIDFGVVIAFHVSNDLDHGDWGFQEYVVLWDRCGYAQLRFYPESATLRFVVERSDDIVNSAWLPNPLGIGNYYFIIASYQFKVIAGVPAPILRLGFLDSASMVVESVTVTGDAGGKSSCSIKSSPLGSMTLLSDWQEQHQATTEAIGTIISARVDKEDADWPTSYFKSQLFFRAYLFSMSAGVLNDRGGAGVILNNEPGTVWNISPKQTELILDRSEKGVGGFDVTCRGSQWEIVDVVVPENFDSRAYAFPLVSGSINAPLQLGDKVFYVMVPQGIEAEFLENLNFRLFDNTGNEEDITSDRIRFAAPVPEGWRGRMQGRDPVSDLYVRGYRIELKAADLGLQNNYACTNIPFVGADGDRQSQDFTFPLNSSFAFLQKLDHTRQSVGLVSASAGNICFSKKLVPFHYYKIAYLGFRDGGVGADSYSIHFAYSENSIDWFVNQREIPLYKTPTPIGKLFLEADGKNVSLFFSNHTNDTIDLIVTEDETGFYLATFESIGAILYPRDGKEDSAGVSSPAVTTTNAGWWCLVHSIENAAGEMGFGIVFSNNFFVWRDRRAEESFHSPGNNVMDEIAIYDPSSFFENFGKQYMAYTGEDTDGVFSILFANLLYEPDLGAQDFGDLPDSIKEYDLANKCRGLFDYRMEEKCILAVFGKAIFRDNNDGNFRLLRTHFRVIGEFFKTLTMQEIPADEYFFDESFAHAVIVTGTFPNQKYYQSTGYTTFLGKARCPAPFGTIPHPMGLTAGAGLTVLNSYKYKLSWESATVEGNVSLPTAEFAVIAAGFARITFDAALPRMAYDAAIDLEDHDVDVRINIYRKEWVTGPGNEPDPLDLTNEHYLYIDNIVVSAADWATAESYVVYTDIGTAATSQLPYLDGHEVGPVSRFCLNHPSSNRLLLFDGFNMYYSDTEFKEAFPTANALNLDDGSGDYIMGVCIWNDDAYVFFQKKVVKIVFRGDEVYPQIISRSIGVVSERSIAPSPIGVFALTNDGVRILTDTGWSEDISKDIKPYLDDAIKLSNLYFREDLRGNKVHAKGGVGISPGAFYDDKYYLDIMEKTNCPRIRLVYSVKKKSWSVHEEFLSGVLLSVLTGERNLLWGSATGVSKLWKVGGKDDYGIPIQARAITKEFDLGRLDLFKQFYEIFPSIDAENGSMFITVICDRGSANYVSMFATPERVVFFDFVPANDPAGAGLVAPGGVLAQAGPLGAVVPSILITPAGMSDPRSKRRAVLPDTMIGKKITFEFFDSGKGAPSEIKAIAFSFTFEDSEL